MWCSRCQQDLSLDRFYKRGGKRAGQYLSICKGCRKTHHGRTKEANRAYYLERRAIIREAKDKPCQRCGIRLPARCMDFHHRDPATKDPQWGQRGHWAFDRLRAEIAKCDVLCANCHRFLHGEDE